MRRTIFVGSLLLLMAPAVMAAQVYKWVDAQGVTHFGTQPPEGTEASSINTNVAPPKPSTPAQPKSQNASDDKQKEVDEQVKEQVAKEESERLARCDQLRQNLAQLKNNPRVRVEEKDGEMRRITEEERQERITSTEKAIQDDCN